VSIWHTQEVHDAATRVLALHPGAPAATHALVEVTIAAQRPAHTAAALMARDAAGVWTIARLYTADHEIPGAVVVCVVGLWKDPLPC
jgi:hypothetical protein